MQSNGEKLRESIQGHLQREQLEKRKEQASKALKKIGGKLQKINLGKLIDSMEQDQGLADSLEKLNGRMKEEVERQEIRREAEARSVDVIQSHMDEFLEMYPRATYEEWIQDLHPENAYQGKLLSDIQEIDARFYVFESDHRRLWNNAIRDKDVYRIVEARTQMWGKTSGAVGSDAEPIDLLSGSVEFVTPSDESSGKNQMSTSSSAKFANDFNLAAASAPFANDSNGRVDKNTKDTNRSNEDLIQF